MLFNHGSVVDAALDQGMDNDVDLSDLARTQVCFNGNSPVDPECAGADLKQDGVVDLADFTLVVRASTGPNPPSDVTVQYGYDALSRITGKTCGDDPLGSVADITDENGSLVESYSHDVFGQPDVASTIGNPYKYTGQRYDTETGLYNYKLRDYSPTLGRFVQPDPLGYMPGPNLYAYVGNNPMNWVDPFGLASNSPKTKFDVEWWEIEERRALMDECFDEVAGQG